MAKTGRECTESETDDLAYLQRQVSLAGERYRAACQARNRRIRELDVAGVANWSIAVATGMREPQTHRIAAGLSGV
jgi:hypothetical protein